MKPKEPYFQELLRSTAAWTRTVLGLFAVAFGGSSFGQLPPVSVKFEQGCEMVRAYFTNNSPGQENTWDFGDGTTSSELHPVHEFPFGTILSVSLTIDNGNGEVITHVLDVETPDKPDLADLEMPNVFTPNGDGINDVFGPITDRILGPCTQISIFNRFGQRLHFGDGYDLTWDGRTFAGEKAVAGTYFYVLKVNGIEFTGTFSLHL